MQLFSDNKADFTEITGILGLIFQIRDDYINLISKDVRTNFLYFNIYFYFNKKKVIFPELIKICHMIFFSICNTKATVKI